MSIEDESKDQNDRSEPMKCPFAHAGERHESSDLRTKPPISRRDFLNGVAVTTGMLGAGNALASALPKDEGLTVPSIPGLGKGPDESAQEVLLGRGITQDDAGYYPPVLSQMRGNHPGSFEIPHATRDGDFWSGAGKPQPTGESYDLIVVGGGISGLAAAHFFRARTGPSARILILDNHDDFGGHAKRNEFHIDGRMLLMNGGTMSIESPFDYSAEAAGLLSELGIGPPALEAKCAKRDFYHSLGLKPAVFFDKETLASTGWWWAIPEDISAARPAPARTGRPFCARHLFLPRHSTTSFASRPAPPITCRAWPSWKRKSGWPT